jgi:hypothetical protein
LLLPQSNSPRDFPLKKENRGRELQRLTLLRPAGFLMGFGFPTGMRLVSTINAGPMPWFWGINGGAGVLAASIAVVTRIVFSIDTTLRIGAACYLVVAAPAVLLMSASARSDHTALGSLHPPKSMNV